MTTTLPKLVVSDENGESGYKLKDDVLAVKTPNNLRNESHIHRATSSFLRALKDEDVFLEAFIEGYEEICLFLECMGLVFRFTVSDIREKLHLLQKFKQSESGEHYHRAAAAMDYEVSQGSTNTGRSASRTLLLLKRALHFIASLMQRLAEASPDAKASHIASEVYKATLSKHHEWIVRKAVGLGVKTLPHVGDLLSRMQPNTTHEEIVESLNTLVSALQPLGQCLHKLLEEKSLLHLK